MDSAKSLKIRRYIYLAGLILIFQVFIFLPFAKGLTSSNIVKSITLFGFYFICSECLFTLILVFKKKVKFIEFFSYLFGVLVVIFIGLYLYAKSLSQNGDPRTYRNTTKTETR